MRLMICAFLASLVAACAPPSLGPSSGPSAAITALRDQFEAKVLAIEPGHRDDPSGLQRAATAIALEVYGSKWDVVRAEAKRAIAALPEIELSAYATATPGPSAIPPEAMKEMQPYMTPAGLAMLRYWDPVSVGSSLAPMMVRLDESGDSVTMIGTKLALVPMRIWRGAFEGEDVIAVRYMRSMIIAPYALTAEGMIMPTLTKVRVYPFQANAAP